MALSHVGVITVIFQNRRYDNPAEVKNKLSF